MRPKEPEPVLPDGPFRLYFDDVRDIVAIIREHSDEVRISTATHHLETIDELRNLDDPIASFEVRGLKAYAQPSDLPPDEKRPKPLEIIEFHLSRHTERLYAFRDEPAVFSKIQRVLLARRRGRWARMWARPTIVHPYPRRERKSFWREHWPKIVLHTITSAISLGLGYLLGRLK